MPDDNSDSTAGAGESAAGGESGSTESGAQRHQIRFVARTLDGEEVYSAPLSLTPGEGAALQAKIAAAYWGHAQYLNGDTAYACASAHGAEGAVVRFIVEKKSGGGGWTQATRLTARVRDEKAVAEWPLPRLPAGTKIRFRAETSVSRQTSIESTVGGGAASSESDGAAPGKPPPQKPAPQKPAPEKPAPQKPAPEKPAPQKPAPPAKPPPAPPAAKPPPGKPPPPPPPAAKPPPPPPAKPTPQKPPPPPPAAKPPPPPPPKPAPQKPPPPPPPPAQKAAPPKPPPPPPPAQHGECVVFEHINFGGWQLHYKTDCDWIGDRYNDKISSIKVMSGRWRFYQDIHYGGPFLELGPGDHSFVGKEWNDRISSFKQIDAPGAAAPPAGKPPPGKPGPHGGGGGGRGRMTR